MLGLKSKSKASKMQRKWWQGLTVDDKLLYTVKDKGTYIVTVVACQGSQLWIKSDCGTVDLLFDPSFQQENIEEYTQKSKLAYFIEKGDGNLSPSGGWTPEKFADYLIDNKAFNGGFDKVAEAKVYREVADLLFMVQAYGSGCIGGGGIPRMSAMEAQEQMMGIIRKALQVD